MSSLTCKKCRYYIQHYALNERKLYRVYCGHCTYNKGKPKRPDTAACPNYCLGEYDEARFATKEYLSKALLEYMLKLELLPEIDNLPFSD